MPWLQRALPAEEEYDMIFNTPLCPEACFDKMQDDKHSKCNPLQPTPSGVESSGPPRKAAQPFKVGAWNRTRDEELRRLESLARDGLRASNAQLLAFAHLANSLVSPEKSLSDEERTRTVDVVRT
jgi:hypothetical protein